VKIKRIILAVATAPIAYSAVAGFEIEGTPALTTETGLMSNRTHYEQDARANFRMPDAVLVPAQKRYADANAKLVVDKAYRVVTHKGTGKAAKARGYADSVPLDSALAMVIPKGWQVYQGADLKDEDIPVAVSFEGGKEWPDVLAALGEYNALRFHIDWYDKTVMMSKGRPVYTSHVSRIRIIDEPTGGTRSRILGGVSATKTAPANIQKPKLLAAGAAEKPEANKSKAEDAASRFANAAVVSPAKPAEPIVTGTGKAEESKDAAGNKAVAQGKPAQSVKAAESSAVTKSVAEQSKPKPTGFSLFVREGFLHENIVRLSKEQGWNAPEWKINSDFVVSTSFSVSGQSFPEAMAKLLMIHPVEADINTNQRKIYVTKEIK